MESSHNLPREKSRPPYPRTASRSSTSTGHSRVMSQSANSSSSLITSSPKLSNAHTTHRYHHANCSKPTPSPRPLSRPTPQLSREGSVELGNPVSSFLQERLQSQRQAEAYRSSASRSHGDTGSPIDLSASVQKSPSKAGGSDANRPQSSNGSEQTGGKGPGLKEMEKVISGLHKQNFDLKLELYHRRERQSALEEKVETLEVERNEAVEENQRFHEELEKRDKAVEEAVAMIVTLEARLEQIMQERDMVRRIEDEGVFSHLAQQQTALEVPSPRSKSLDVSKLEEDAHAIARMPSFLSDRTEGTENLRRVYLGARGSIISLNQAADESPDANKEPHAGLASPSLSVLSESSFVSIYGKKDEAQAASFRVDEPLSLDGPSHDDGGAGRPGNYNESNSHSLGSGLPARSGSHLLGHNQRHFQPIANVMEGPLLQSVDKSESFPQQRRHTLRTSDSSRNLAADSSQKLGSPSRIKTRDERREEMRKVMTDSPGGVSLKDPGMPPTPDTISSATLRRMKNSNDTLLQRRETADRQSSQGSSYDLASAHDIPTDGVPLRSSVARSNDQRHREEVFGQLPWQQAASIPRPRSADETTVSNRRERRWSTDSKDSEGSLESSIDIWLRQAGARTKGRESPGLFNFPVDADRGSWAMDAMFGPGSTYAPASTVQSNSDQMRDLISAQQALFGATRAPPAPERQSSMQAQTGSRVAAEQAKGGNMPRRRGRHTRRNSDDVQMRAQMKTPAPEQFASEMAKPPPNGEQKRGHYPPIVGHQGARNGLKRLWRRSLGAASNSSPAEVPAAEPSPTAAAVVDDGAQTQQPEAATWISRSGAVEEDRTGATPPPIMRNPRQRQENEQDGELQAPSTPRMTQAEPTTPKTAVPPGMQAPSPAQPPHQQPEAAAAAGQATGARRKWLLNLGRSNGGKPKGA